MAFFWHLTLKIWTCSLGFFFYALPVVDVIPMLYKEKIYSFISYTGKTYVELCLLVDVNSVVIILLGFSFATSLFSYLRMIENNWQSDLMHLTDLRCTITFKMLIPFSFINNYLFIVWN